MEEIKYLKFRWFVLATMVIATAAEGMILISPSPLVGEIANTMKLDLGTVTAAMMLPFTFFVAIGSIIGGFILDKIGLVKTYISSTIILIIASLLIPIFGHSLLGVVILRIVQGLGAGPIMATVSKIAAEWFPSKERAIVTGLQGAGLALGIAIGFVISPAIYSSTKSFTETMAFLAVGPAIALVLSIIFAFGPKSVGNNTLLNDEDYSTKIASDFKLAIKHPAFWITFLCVFAMSWVGQAYNDLTPGHISVDAPVGIGLGAQTAGSMMGLYQIAGIVGAIASGFIAERIFKGKLKLVVALGFLLGGFFAVSVLFPFVISNTTILLICLILVGFLINIVNPLCFAFISKNYPDHITGKVGGLIMGLGIFGGSVGVSVGSFALHTTGLYTASILVVGAVCLIGFVLSLGLNPPKIFADRTNK